MQGQYAVGVSTVNKENATNQPLTATDSVPAGQKKICIEDFSLKLVLGKGSFGKVILVKKYDNNRFYAMKVIKKSLLSKDTQFSKLIVERSILAGIDHPFIMKLYYSFQSETRAYFVLEYCPGGDLFRLVRKIGCFNEDLTKFYTAQVVIAIEHLHSRNIIYRDLKPENVMIDFEGFLKLTDFGLSEDKIQAGSKTFAVCGTPEYLAPEVLLTNGYTNVIDWWQLGAFMFELLTGFPPFYNKDQNVMFNAILNSELMLPAELSVVCKDLLMRLLTKNPEQRLGVNGSAEIKSHPFFANIDWAILYHKQYRPPFIPSIEQDFGLCNFSDDFKNLPLDSLTNSAKDSANRKIEGFTYNQSQGKYYMDRMQEEQ